MARVLLVDDDAGVLDTCGAILRHAGLDVEAAGSGRSALGVLARLSCDLLLIDLRLPDISGLDLLAEVRRRGCTNPAVFVTGHPSLETSLEAIRLGAVDYLMKPVFDDALLAAVDRALRLPPRNPLILTANVLRRALDNSPAQGSTALVGDQVPYADGLALWASAVCQVVHASRDVPTVGRWAVLLKISPETVYRWCRTVRLEARTSLNLGRVLRAVRCAHQHGSTPGRFLVVSDRRTLERVLRQGGVGPGPVPAIADVLARQTLVPDPLAVAMLRARLIDPAPSLDSA